MGMWIGRNRKARVTYGFDEIALVPGEVTINPMEVDTSFSIPRKDGSAITLKIPIIASAMDGVTDVRFCMEMGKLGGLGVINLEGVQTRYENPAEVLDMVVKANKDEVTSLIQKLYLEPIREELIGRRVQELKQAGVLAAVSSIPQKAERFAAIAQEAGADLFVVQSTVSTVRHISTQYKSLELEKFVKSLKIPVIIGNALAYGSDAVMVGSAFARAEEAPGRGYHWGMATPHANLPRGTRIKVGISGSLQQILFGPATVDDGSQNLVGAITTCMGNVGAASIRQFQETEIIIAPSIKTEGKLFQTVQSVGMGTR